MNSINLLDNIYSCFGMDKSIVIELEIETVSEDGEIFPVTIKATGNYELLRLTIQSIGKDKPANITKFKKSDDSFKINIAIYLIDKEFDKSKPFNINTDSVSDLIKKLKEIVRYSISNISISLQDLNTHSNAYFEDINIIFDDTVFSELKPEKIYIKMIDDDRTPILVTVLYRKDEVTNNDC